VTKLRWNGDYTADGRYMIQVGSIYHGPGVPREREYETFFMPGTPEVVSIGIHGRRRDAKRAAQEHADGA
jgi:hypothetical protein